MEAAGRDRLEHRRESLLQVDVQELPGVVLISASGELDNLTAPRLRTTVEDVIDGLGDRRLVLDLAELTFLGSPGLHVLVVAAKAVGTDQQPALRVVTGGKRIVLRPIRICGLASVLRLHDSVDAALADLTGAP